VNIPQKRLWVYQICDILLYYMVKRLAQFVTKEIAGIHHAAYLIGFFTLMSQILALFRDRLLAYSFGAGKTLDLYYAAFRVPDFVFATLASLVSVAVLIPFFSATSSKGTEAVKKLMSELFSFFVSMMAVVSTVLFFLMPKISHYLFPGFDSKEILTVISISRVLLLQPIFLGISNLLSVITQMNKRFFIYAIAPIFYNLAIILGIVFLYPKFGLQGIVIGVVFGAILHFLIQAPYVGSLGQLPRFTFKWDFKRLLKILALSIPRTITLSASQLELIFITSFASVLTAGSISIFSLATNLQSVPFAIVGVSYTLAAFPLLSMCYVNGKKKEFVEHVQVATRHILFWSLPITALFIILRAQIVRVILGSGSFNWNDTRLTAASVALFVISLSAQSLELLFIRAYYAAGKTIKPLFINLFSSVLTITLPYLFLQLFAHNPAFSQIIERLFRVVGIPGTEVLMLPLGYMFGTIVNMIIFWMVFEKDFGEGSFTKNVGRTLWQSFESAVVAGYMAYITLNLSEPFIDQTKVFSVFLHGLLGGVVGVISWAGVLFLLRNEEVIEVWGSFRKRIPLFAGSGVVTVENKKASDEASLIVTDTMLSESDVASH